MNVIQERSDKLTTSLNKRELERKLDIEKKQEGKKQLTAEHEKLDYFTKTFNEQRLEIENALSLSASVEMADLPNHFNTIYKDILILQKYAASSKIFLRMYDVERCLETVHELTLRAKELEEKLIPKKKFGFKNKKRIPKLNGHSKDVVDCATTRYSYEKNLCGFGNRKDETLTMQNSDVYKKDIVIHDVENCFIKLYGTPSTLHLNQLRNCLVISGPVSTSIFAENCSNVKLVIACQQLRLHSSSTAIMEDCDNVLIAPYNLKYDGLNEDFVKAGLDRSTNNWTSIDDFNWLNIQKESPNWRILQEHERINDWNTY
ncbi:hypothetical protein RI129_008005, partial [Pyrocoelia pectoralis]